MPDENIKLPGEWSLRKLSVPHKTEWALQFKGMDWVRISEFLHHPSARSTLDDDIRRFAADMNAHKG